MILYGLVIQGRLQKLIDVVHNYCNRWRLLEIRKKGSGCGENIDCLECVVIDT